MCRPWRVLETREAGDAKRSRLHHGVTFSGLAHILAVILLKSRPLELMLNSCITGFLPRKV
jgi:hypothetical protein